MVMHWHCDKDVKLDTTNFNTENIVYILCLYYYWVINMTFTDGRIHLLCKWLIVIQIFFPKQNFAMNAVNKAQFALNQSYSLRRTANEKASDGERE